MRAIQIILCSMFCVDCCLAVHLPSLFAPSRSGETKPVAKTTAERVEIDNRLPGSIETKQAAVRFEKRRKQRCPAAFDGVACDAVAKDVPKCFPRLPFNDWISVHKNVFFGASSSSNNGVVINDSDDSDSEGTSQSSVNVVNETFVFCPDTPSLRRSRHDEKAKDAFAKKTAQQETSDIDARKIWYEKQMIEDKKKKKIKVNGKVFVRGEVPERDIFGEKWFGKVDGTVDEKQMFAKKASFKTCAVVSSGSALKGKKYGKTIDEHGVVIRLNNAPTIGYEEDVGSFTTLRLTNTQYEGVREYEDETVLTKWNGNPMDLMRLGTKKTYAMNPAFRQWAQQLDDTLNNHIVTSGLLMLFLALQKCERVSAFGFGGKELEKWYYDKRPSGKIPKSAWLSSGRGVVKYENWNQVNEKARENALSGAKENRKLAEQPKVKVYGNKDKKIGTMLGIGAGKTASSSKKKPKSPLDSNNKKATLDSLESAEEVESDMIRGEIEDDDGGEENGNIRRRRRRKLLNMVSHVISRERQCMASLADFGVISIYS